MRTALDVPPGLADLYVPQAHGDGETQYLARLSVRNQHPETGDVPMAVVVDHGRSTEWGGQAFHDLNLLGVSMSAAVAIAADNRDPATKMAETDPVLVGQVSFDARQVSARSGGVMTITTLRRATVAGLVGRKVFALGNKPLDEDLLEHASRDYRNRGYRPRASSAITTISTRESYYQRLGFTVLDPGEPLLLRIPGPSGGVLSYPAESTMRQIWRPLKPNVGVIAVADGHLTLQVIDNVL
jgi:hypothetical protein